MAARKQPAPLSLADVAKLGDRRKTLEAMRDMLAASMEDAQTGVKPQYAAQLRETLRELDELPVAEEASAVDEIAARRKTRRAASATDGVPAGRSQQRRR
jgi:hypothetical protein